MKVLRAKIEVSHEDGGTSYVGYPQVWLDNKNRIPAILYPKDRSDELAEGGKTYQLLYPVVPDDLVDTFLSDPNITLADAAEVQAYSDKHAPSKEIITDQTAVLTVLARQARGLDLTTTDLEVIDPSSETPGITMTKSFTDIAKDYGADNLQA